MARTPLFGRMLETLFISSAKAPSDEAVQAARQRPRGVSRRDLLKVGGAAAAAMAASNIVGCAAPTGEPTEGLGRSSSPLKKINANIGIVGAGIGGIACAYELRRVGVVATVHEANTRVGGRIWSNSDAKWLGQTIERGGELIDTPHKTMQGYAKELGLQLETYLKPNLPVFYKFGGQMVSEATMVDEYRQLVDGMHDALQAMGTPTAYLHNDSDVYYDNLSLDEWLDLVNAPKNIKALLKVAYAIEYGVATSAMSSLAFLQFAKASKQAKLRLWGNWSDERYHVIGGNDQIPRGLADRLPGQILFERKLVRARKLSDGRIELTFTQGSKTITATHDAVVFALPYHLLRGVELDPSLGFPADKLMSIQNFVCGNNAKLMIGFQGRPWIDAGCNGAAYSDMPYLQTSWETNGSLANATRAVLTDYTGDALAVSLSPQNPQGDADRFLSNYDAIIPGSKARARRDAKGNYVCHLEHWPSNPLTQGAYSANQPGYFTTIEGIPQKAVGNVFFAGEMTDSFYNWQGFMEGGAETGVRAAGEILAYFT